MLISYLESTEVEMQELKLKSEILSKYILYRYDMWLLILIVFTFPSVKHFVGYEADDEERDCPSFKDFFTTGICMSDISLKICDIYNLCNFKVIIVQVQLI